MKLTKEQSRTRIHFRIRKKIKGVASSPRISVFRSNKVIYAQIIDDTISHTLVAADSRENDILGVGTKVEQAYKVGQLLAERAKEANISEGKNKMILTGLKVAKKIFTESLSEN
jgi:large subunit ribosomal protein L18